MATEWNPPAIPALPTFRGEITSANIDAENNILRLYFRQLNGTLSAIKTSQTEIQQFNQRYTLIMT